MVTLAPGPTVYLNSFRSLAVATTTQVTKMTVTFPTRCLVTINLSPALTVSIRVRWPQLLGAVHRQFVNHRFLLISVHEEVPGFVVIWIPSQTVVRVSDESINVL